MNDCVFCKIIVGKIPATTVYEDEHTLAFLDINPVNPGHTLVVPKKHSENLYTTDADDLRYTIETAQKVARALKKIGADGVNIIMNNGPVAGQVVPHAHLHVIPRKDGDGFQHWHGTPYAEGEDRKIAEEITAAF